MAKNRSKSGIWASAGILGNLKDGVAVISSSYQIQYENTRLSSEFALTQSGICYERYAARTSPCPSCPLTRPDWRERTSTFEIAVGTGRTYELHSSVVISEDGSPAAIDTLRDITAAQAVLARIRESLAAFDRHPDAVILLKPNGRIVHANKAALKSFGEGILLQQIDGVLAGSPGFDGHALISSAIRTGSWAGELAFLTDAQASQSTFLFAASALKDAGGEPCAVLLTGKDISRERSSAREMKDTCDKLKNLDDNKSKLVSTVSHELKTPITVVKANIEYLIDTQDLTEEQKKRLSTINTHVSRMSTLIQEVLDMYRIDEGKFKLDISTVDLRKLIQSSVKNVEPLLERRGHRIEIDLDHDLPHVPADEKRLAIVIENLLTNAMKAMHERGTVRITASLNDKFVRLSVQDEGPGIPVEEQSRIFERFYTRNAKHSNSGAGLGLSIAKAIIDQHGGRIDVDSKPGSGACFHVLLPAGDRTRS